MDEEGAINNVIKQKKKDKKSEAHNTGTVKAAASTISSENESTCGVIRDQKKDKEKKKNKFKVAKDSEADMKKGSSKGELFVVSGENGEEETDNAERNGESSGGLKSDNAEGKRKRREKKDKKEKSKMQDAEEVKRDVGSTDLQEEERVSAKESAKEGKEEKKKQKVKKDDIKDIKVGEKDGEVSESCAANATEVRKERKKEKKKSKRESVVESKDTHNENKCDEADLSSKQQENVLQYVDDGPQSTKDDGSTKTNNEKKKKKKHKKKENAKDDLPAARQEHVDNGSKINTEKKKKKKHKQKENAKDDSPAAQQEHVDNGTDTLKETQNDEAEPSNKRKKKKGQFGNGSNDDQVNEAEHANKGKKRKSSLVVNGSNDTSPNKSNKKVRFSDQNEVFPPELVKGKRFTPEEDEIVRDAVFKYIEEKDLGDEGVEMILNCGKHRALRGCWKEIASAIPYRPYLAIYFRARILLMRSESRKWTQEEYDMIKEYQEKHGNKWKPLADELGKHAWHVKDTWRRIKLPNVNKGHWSQEEYQRLFDLVNTDLQLKISEEKKSKHGMLRDNICWTAISDELATRAQAMCCRKWYKQLTSPMVAEGAWADSDDYRLLSALYSLDATCMEDVEWDSLIDNRSGEVCRKRWNQMVLHIGHHGNKSFAEQVEVLAERYCPHLLEAREIWDNKPSVP